MHDLELDFGGLKEDTDGVGSASVETSDSAHITDDRTQLETNAEQPDFETALTRLEKIVEEMEKGRLNLEECMTYFEEGNRLVTYCSSKLRETEKKVEVLIKNDASGDVSWQKFEDIEETQVMDE